MGQPGDGVAAASSVEQDCTVRKATAGGQGFAPKPVKDFFHGFAGLL
jgi:hypothetical protein